MLQMPRMGGATSWNEVLAGPGTDSETRSALCRFRRLLGDRWTGWQTGAPLANRFHTRFQDNPPEGVRLARLVDALEGVPNRDIAVRQGLSSDSWENFTSAVMGLEVASRLKAANISVEFVKNDHTKSPDLRIHPAERAVVVELKALHDRQEEQDWDALHDLLFEMGAPFTLHDLDIDFESPALDFPDAVHEGLALVCEQEDADWHDLPMGTGRARRKAGELACHRLPFAQKPPIERIRLKLKSWCKQLENQSDPTLIVVDAPYTFNFSSSERLIQQTQELEEQLRPAIARKRMISGLLVCEKPFLPPLPRRLCRVGGVALMTGSLDGFGIVGALLLNPFARVRLANSELQAIISSVVERATPEYAHNQ